MRVDEMLARPAERLHWYTRTGEPCYEVQRKDGKGLRATTLRDAKQLGLVPSVTSIIRCAAAPGLEHYKQRQVLLAALTLPRDKGESDDDYLKRVMHDSQEHARNASSKGSSIHAAVEAKLEGRSPDLLYIVFAEAAVAKLTEAFEGVTWRCERSFSHPLGFGGKVDLSSAMAVGDIKTKEFTDPPTTYPEHAMQIAAYATGLQLNPVHYFNLFVSTSVPGLVHLHLWERSEIERARLMFFSLLEYWKFRNL